MANTTPFLPISNTVIAVNRYMHIRVETDGEYYKLLFDDSSSQSDISEQRLTVDEYKAFIKASIKYFLYTLDMTVEDLLEG